MAKIIFTKLDLKEELQYVNFWFEVSPGVIKHPNADLVYIDDENRAMNSLTGEYIQVFGESVQDQAYYLHYEAPNKLMNANKLSIEINDGKLTISNDNGSKTFEFDKAISPNAITASIVSSLESVFSGVDDDVISEKVSDKKEAGGNMPVNKVLFQAYENDQGEDESAFISETPAAEEFEDGKTSTTEKVALEEDDLHEFQDEDKEEETETESDEDQKESSFVDDSLTEEFEDIPAVEEVPVVDEVLSDDAEEESVDGSVEEVVEDLNDLQFEIEELKEELLQVSAALRAAKIENRKLTAALKNASVKKADVVDIQNEIPEIDVTKPVVDVPGDKVEEQFPANEFDDNAGKDKEDFDTSTNQNWAPGESGEKTASEKLAGEFEAMRLAELLVEFGKIPAEKRWVAAEQMTKEVSSTVVAAQIEILEALPKPKKTAAVKTASSIPSMKKITTPKPLSGKTSGAGDNYLLLL